MDVEIAEKNCHDFTKCDECRLSGIDNLADIMRYHDSGHTGILHRIAEDIQQREPRARYLLKQYGSFRRLMVAYWKGELTPKDEAEIEQTFRPEDRVGYRPL